jgi:DNA-binding MarR family transcriptional regulator
MRSQVLSEQSSAVRAFVALVRSHAAVTRRLSVELTNDHGLTINDYEVLLRLARAPERRMRRVDLAVEVLLTPSGITRLLEGLERAGFVERGTCETDRRVVYAVLTDAGLTKVREASTTHVAQIDDLFAARLDGQELATIADLMSRLGEAAVDEDCRPPEA